MIKSIYIKSERKHINMAQVNTISCYQAFDCVLVDITCANTEKIRVVVGKGLSIEETNELEKVTDEKILGWFTEEHNTPMTRIGIL